jgi:DNA-binding MarR family transcriptional regulator
MATLICLPAHILDAAITPRAREVLMLLASQTSAESPALWICQSTIAKRLRCSVSTVARAIAALIEAKLIAETGRLHEGRYKFYHVRWKVEENIKAASKKITKPIRKVVANKVKPVSSPIEGVQLILPPVADELFVAPLPPMPEASTLSSTYVPQATNDSRIAYYAEIARKRHQENRQLHKSMMLSLRLSADEAVF